MEQENKKKETEEITSVDLRPLHRNYFKTSPYFTDRNSFSCTKELKPILEDSEKCGEMSCLQIIKEAPFQSCNPIIPPVFMDMTVVEPYFVQGFVTESYVEKGKFYITVDIPLKKGDVIRSQKNKFHFYHVIKVLPQTSFGRTTAQITVPFVYKIFDKKTFDFMLRLFSEDTKFYITDTFDVEWVNEAKKQDRI